MIVRTCLAAFFFFSLALSTATAQTSCPGGYETDGDELPCDDGTPCCTVPYACNGPNSACNNYDPDFESTNGCDLSCTAGCMDAEAANFDPDADFEDGSCTYPEVDDCAASYNPDFNCDSLINFEDFLNFLTLFGEEFIPASIDANSGDGSDSTGTDPPNYSIDFANDTLYLIQDDTLVLNQVPFNLCCGEVSASDLFAIQSGPTTVEGTVLGDTIQLKAGRNYFIEVVPGGFSHTYANGCCYAAAASLAIERTDGNQVLDWDSWPSSPTSVSLYTVSPCESYHPQPIKNFRIHSNIDQSIHFVGVKSTDCILGGSVTVHISE